MKYKCETANPKVPNDHNTSKHLHKYSYISEAFELLQTTSIQNIMYFTNTFLSFTPTQLATTNLQVAQTVHSWISCQFRRIRTSAHQSPRPDAPPAQPIQPSADTHSSTPPHIDTHLAEQ